MHFDGAFEVRDDRLGHVAKVLKRRFRLLALSNDGSHVVTIDKNHIVEVWESEDIFERIEDDSSVSSKEADWGYQKSFSPSLHTHPRDLLATRGPR